MARMIKPAGLAVVTLLGAGAPPGAAQDFNYLGQVIYIASNYCPQGSLPADGRLLKIDQYQVLFSLMGPSFGGDGKTTFALPKIEMPGRAGAVGLACVVVQGHYPEH